MSKEFILSPVTPTTAALIRLQRAKSDYYKIKVDPDRAFLKGLDAALAVMSAKRKATYVANNQIGDKRVY